MNINLRDLKHFRELAAYSIPCKNEYDRDKKDCQRRNWDVSRWTSTLRNIFFRPFHQPFMFKQRQINTSEREKVHQKDKRKDAKYEPNHLKIDNSNEKE